YLLGNQEFDAARRIIDAFPAESQAIAKPAAFDNFLHKLWFNSSREITPVMGTLLKHVSSLDEALSLAQDCARYIPRTEVQRFQPIQDAVLQFMPAADVSAKNSFYFRTNKGYVFFDENKVRHLVFRYAQSGLVDWANALTEIAVKRMSSADRLSFF